jgi:hypothetical protein
MKTTTLILCALLAACGDDTQTADGGDDATTQDVASESAAKDATNDGVAADAIADANVDVNADANADVAVDAPGEAASDAGIDAIADAAPETSTGCDGGCTTFSFECSNAKPACQCLGLANGQTGPVCDAAAANCFVDPCLTKTVQCINDTCVLQ